MDQTQVENILSKLVPLALELSARLVEQMDQASNGLAGGNRRIAIGNILNIRTMCDELLDAFCVEKDRQHS